MTGRTYSAYMICTAPRSGSTLLCGLLAGTGIAGEPDSHFHAPSLGRWLEDYGLAARDFACEEDAFRAVLAAARVRGKGQTDIFGLRMQRGSFAYFMRQLAMLWPDRMGDIGRIEAAFGPTLLIHLSRADRLGQAISRVRAEQSGLWHRNSDGTELERLTPPMEPRYDAAAIKRHMVELSAFDAAWEQWFAQVGVTPLRLSYDALSDDPQGVLGRVLSALQLDPAVAQTVATPTARLADGVSAAWRARFEAES